jgi:hypothetical protein
MRNASPFPPLIFFFFCASRPIYRGRGCRQPNSCQAGPGSAKGQQEQAVWGHCVHCRGKLVHAQRPQEEGTPSKGESTYRPLPCLSRPPSIRRSAIVNCDSHQEKKDDSGAEEPAPKRKRGRPPKNPKPEAADGATSGDAAEPSAKKKRGRPPKKTTE